MDLFQWHVFPIHKQPGAIFTHVHTFCRGLVYTDRVTAIPLINVVGKMYCCDLQKLLPAICVASSPARSDLSPSQDGSSYELVTEQ